MDNMSRKLTQIRADPCTLIPPHPLMLPGPFLL